MIEAMVAITVLAMLLAVAVPALQQWSSDARMRAVAESLQTGLRIARTESLRRSRQVVLSLTNSATAGDTVTAVENGRYWAVHVLPTMTGGETAELLQSGVVAELGEGVSVTGPASICFNSVGRLVANTATALTAVTGGATCAITAAPVYDVTMPGASRRLRLLVSLGGQLRLCDPDKTLSATQPDGCP